MYIFSYRCLFTIFGAGRVGCVWEESEVLEKISCRDAWETGSSFRRGSFRLIQMQYDKWNNFNFDISFI